MPFIQIHTSRSISPQVREHLGLALANAYGEHMQTSHRIVNVGFVPYAQGDLVRYDADGDAPQEMTIVTCNIRTGRTPEMHESLGRAITSAVSRALDLPEARIAVYLTEHAAHLIYRDGGRAPEWSPGERIGR